MGGSLLHAAVLFCLVIFQVSLGGASPCPDKQAGIVRWSAWSEKPNTEGAKVTVGPNDKILLDVSPPFIDHIDVYGTLVIDPDVPSIELNVSSVYVRRGGIFYIGSESCPLSNRVTITLFGTPQPGVDPNGVGTKVLGVLNGGTLEIHGKVRKPVWTVLTETTSINATQITLLEEVDWAIGEQIIIATTDFENFADEAGYPSTQNELVTITGRPSPNSVSFSPPLKYIHYGKIWSADNGDSIDMRGEVGLISRNILIHGDTESSLSTGSVAQNWGGHIMIRDGGIGRIEYIEVTKLGQQGEFGRYPLHFHNSSAQPNSYLRGNSIHDTFQRCIVVHSTFKLRVQNNIAYRGKGHCYFIEDGNEEENVFEHNLGVKALVGDLLTSDKEPAMFWITNANNHFYNNVAVGGKMGYWYSMPVHPLALSESQIKNKLRFMKNGDFIGNKAHSANSGLFVDHGLKNAKPGDADTDSSYMPTDWTKSLALAERLGVTYDIATMDEYALSTLGYRTPAHFIDFTAYKCVEVGMWGRGSFMHSYGAKLADNQIGCVWPGNANLMQNTLMVGETDNVGAFNVVKNAWWGDEEGRNRGTKWFMENPVVGYSSYDASGGDFVIDITFHNFNDFTFQKGTNAGKVRKTGALTGISGPNVIEPMNRIYRAKFFNVQNRVYYRHSYPWDPVLSETDDAVKGIAWIDADGSILAGLPEAGCGKKIVGTGALVRTGSCVKKTDWNAWICPADSKAHRAFYVSQSSTVTGTDDDNRPAFRQTTDIHLQRLSDNAILDIEADIRDIGEVFSANLNFGTNLPVNENYYMTFGNASNTFGDFRIQINDMIANEKIRIAIPYPPTTMFTILSGYGKVAVPQVDSFAKLTENTYYFNSDVGILWIHLQTSDINYEYTYGIPQPSSTSLIYVTADCRDGNTKLCQYTPGRPVPTTPGATTGSTANLCETSGAITKGYKTYTSKSTTALNIFEDGFVAPFFAGSIVVCNATTSVAYEGTASLHCLFKAYEGIGLAVRLWTSADQVVNVDGFTHLQFAIKAAPGYGDIGMRIAAFNQSWVQFKDLEYTHNPFYTDDAGPITDQKWSIVRIPVSKLVGEGANLWGLLIGSNLNRPIEAYMDSVKFVSLNEALVPVANFPIAPPKPPQVGPGPQFSYPTDNPGTTEGDHIGSGVRIAASFALAILLMILLL